MCLKKHHFLLSTFTEFKYFFLMLYIPILYMQDYKEFISLSRGKTIRLDCFIRNKILYTISLFFAQFHCFWFNFNAIFAQNYWYSILAQFRCYFVTISWITVSFRWIFIEFRCYFGTIWMLFGPNPYNFNAISISLDVSPQIIFLHMLKQHRGLGGDTTISDGFRAAEELRATDAAAFKALTEKKVYFLAKGIDTNYDGKMRHFFKINKTPVIE